jgi:hypothetical protein
MKFGILKSKIEKMLLESYKTNTFKNEIKNFNELVLKNKNMSKLFYLYDELNSNKNLSESVANEYIFESIKIYENIVNKLGNNSLLELNKWVSSVSTENLYEHIDSIFNLDVLNIESNIKSRKHISESLQKTPIKKQESLNIPLSAMVNVANKTITNFIENLDESDKKELFKLLSEDDKSLSDKFDSLKESVINKLEKIKMDENDKSVQSSIDSTLSKVIHEKYDKLTYFKLKNLNENL